VEGFIDRVDAGRQLAQRLMEFRADPETVVIGLPRGGVPVAYEVALALGLALDVLLVRKVGVPFQEEVAMGAIGEGGVVILDREVMASAQIGEREFELIERRERGELERRVRRFRGDRPSPLLEGRTALIIDDGLATGSTARAACRVARAQGARRVVLAVPVAAKGSLATLLGDADQVVAVKEVEGSFAVGQWYEHFDQTQDEEVVDLLERSRERVLAPVLEATVAPLDADAPRDEDVLIDLGAVRLPGRFTLPEGANGVVVFVHGSGSSRFSSRNRAVAQALNEHGIGTLLFDLLTNEEELDRSNVFDIELLTRRLLGVTTWVKAQPRVLTYGYFGASTGAAAALLGAAQVHSQVAAVVARGGRVDLAGERVRDVTAPTLFIVGGADQVVLALNESVLRKMICERRLEVVDGATHLFEEPGALEKVTALAVSWFAAHLASSLHVAT